MMDLREESFVSCEVHDGVAVVTIDRPPDNALCPASIQALIEQLDAAQADPSVAAIVVIGAGGNFSAGADMQAFDPADRGTVTSETSELIARCEAARVPVIAAIDGEALGAGLEAALGCNYRIATPAARLGFPEIRRGLVPGSGGTQRAPRLMGQGPALALILSGEPISGTAACAMGLVDRLAEGALLAEAIAFARGVATQPRRTLRELPVSADAAAVSAARAKAAPPDRGGLAEQRAIDVVAASAALSFEAGLHAEREVFLELARSDQSRARKHLLCAEQESAKLPDGSAPPTFAIRTAAVIGSGTMGTGIALACANVGVPVTLIDVDAESLERAQKIIGGNYAATVRKGRLAQAEMDARLGRIAFATGLAAARDADLVIEAVFEELDVKQDVFRQLDSIVRRDAILATNTSTLDVDRIAGVTARGEDVVGMHFFSPANVMRLLEIVRGERTSSATLGKAIAVAKQFGKIPVVAGNCDGFIGNRMLYTYRREAEFLLEEGAAPQRIDAVLKNFGLAMGPFAMSDLAGLDVGWRVRKRKYAAAPPVGRYSTIADRLCEAGRFGQKTGAGYFRYADGDRTPIPDPFVDDVIAQAAAASGVAQRAIGDDEIVKRCLYPLVNEGARIVEEGIAARPGDIDVVYCHGYGFPAWRGGPLHWADTLGLAKVAAEIARLRAVHGEVWEPAGLLRELANGGGTFAAWKREGVAAAAS
jgi:3-hydroxyacyl-CoA dehydrogenase